MKISGNLASIGTLDYKRMRNIHKKDDIFLQLGLLFGEYLGDVEGAEYSKAWTCCSKGYNCGCLKCVEKKMFFMHDYTTLEM
jgi:hypothetical protein